MPTCKYQLAEPLSYFKRKMFAKEGKNKKARELPCLLEKEKGGR